MWWLLLLFKGPLTLFADFQNYLRTQTGNNTTVNIIISTVDYLLRVQVDVFHQLLNQQYQENHYSSLLSILCFTIMGLNIKWINVFGLVLLTFSSSLLVTVLLTSPLIRSSSGVHQWLLLVLFWERCYWWTRPTEFFQSHKCGQAGFQYAHWVHPGMKKTALHIRSFVVAEIRLKQLCASVCFSTLQSTHLLTIRIFSLMKSLKQDVFICC